MKLSIDTFKNIYFFYFYLQVAFTSYTQFFFVKFARKLCVSRWSTYHVVVFLVVLHHPRRLAVVVVLSESAADAGPAVRQGLSASVLQFVCGVQWRQQHPWPQSNFETLKSGACMHDGVTLIFLLKLRSFRFLMYLWIFSRLSSTVMRALLKLASSRLDASAAAGSRPGLMLPPPPPIWRAPPTNKRVMHACVMVVTDALRYACQAV